jgi:hypothetical protein
MTEQEAQDKFGNYIKDAAFPQTVETSEKIFHTKGLTKREYFAAMALQGILADGMDIHLHEQGHAKKAVLYADALIKALNESQP